MAKEVPWTKIFLDEFADKAGLNEEEINIVRTRMLGWTRVKQSREFHMSLATIDRMIRRLKVKYDQVQPYSDILPPRKYSVEETYMDKRK